LGGAGVFAPDSTKVRLSSNVAVTVSPTFVVARLATAGLTLRVVTTPSAKVSVTVPAPGSTAVMRPSTL
jgi:hypothetical protein